MEKKEKIVLADGTEIEIESGAAENCVQVVLPNLDGFKELFEKFSEENLESYRIQNADGLTCAVIDNKHLVSSLVEQRENGIRISLNLADVDMLSKRVKALEAGQAEMKAGQEVQDGAIADLGEIVGEMLEGGEA